MTVVLCPLDKKLHATVSGEEFISALFVWGRLWRIFSTFSDDLLTRKQREYRAVPEIVKDEDQQVSAQHVQEILRRIIESIMRGTFEEKTAAAWQYGESACGLGAAAKSDWPRFLEFVPTLGINRFLVRGRIWTCRGAR